MGKLSEDQKVSMFKDALSGLKVSEICKKYSIDEATYYKLQKNMRAKAQEIEKPKYNPPKIEFVEVKEDRPIIKELKIIENSKLKKILIEYLLANKDFN